MNDTRIPILIVTGFLESGKTTFINNGCVCCTMNGKLEGVFGNLAKEKDFIENYIKDLIM